MTDAEKVQYFKDEILRARELAQNAVAKAENALEIAQADLQNAQQRFAAIKSIVERCYELIK